MRRCWAISTILQAILTQFSTQATALPSKESKKNALAAAAAQLVKAAVIGQAPSSKLSSDTKGLPGDCANVSSSRNPNRLSAHDSDGNLKAGIVTQNRLDKVTRVPHHCRLYTL